MFFKNTLRGFSLVELLVYITIFSIVSVSIWQAFIWFQKNHINFTEQQKISFDIDHLYDLLNKDISAVEAKNISANDLVDNYSNCISSGDITYYFDTTNSNLYKGSVCAPNSNPILENINLNSRPKFFLITSHSESYKEINYSFVIIRKDKSCCETNRTIFSSLQK